VTIRYMLDTNICIFVMSGRGPALATRFEREAAYLGMSIVTLAELTYGVEKSAARTRNQQALAAFAARIEVLDFDPAAAAAYGTLRARLERAGRVIGPYDLMIAAHAISRNMTLVTNNRREFDRVDGLLVEDWSA
jgi:tRNA(fMet)-specific endonuclease VapC